MRKILIAVAILLQAAALGWIVFERENVLQKGQVVYLRTAPVDPRDIFRGDYVTLRYDINNIPVALATAAFPEKENQKDMRVYASLAVDAQGMATVTALHTKPPAEGLYLRGYTSNDWRLRGSDTELAVRFGIEKMFVAQGAGKLIETQQGARNDWQTPMEVAVAVGKNGIGVIRDYRWSSFATRLELLNMQANGQDSINDQNLVNEQRPRPTSPRVRFSIRNESTDSMALANAGNDCSYELLAVDGESFTMANDVCSAVIARPEDVHVLAPGESYVREMDMSQARWHIRRQDKSQGISAGEIGQFNGTQRFRLVYRAPRNAAELSTAELPTAEPSTATVPVWVGTINSAAFNNHGNID